MAGKGPAPKPEKIRQRRNKKAGAMTLEAKQKLRTKIPALQNPDKRKFHRLTRAWWKRLWESPMARGYFDTDIDGLARLALLVDDFYKEPGKDLMGEIRLQEARFGLSPIDRSRLQWSIAKGDDPEETPQEPAGHHTTKPKKAFQDPRGILGVVK